MVHQGQRIYSIAQMKGYNKSKLARELGKTHQAVDYDLKKQIVNIDTLEKYANILQVEVKEFQKEEVVPNSIYDNQDTSSLQKLIDYLKKENDFLRNYINENITVGLGKFDVISLPRVSELYFFGYANTTDNNCGF